MNVVYIFLSQPLKNHSQNSPTEPKSFPQNILLDHGESPLLFLSRQWRVILWRQIQVLEERQEYQIQERRFSQASTSWIRTSVGQDQGRWRRTKRAVDQVYSGSQTTNCKQGSGRKGTTKCQKIAWGTLFRSTTPDETMATLWETTTTIIHISILEQRTVSPRLGYALRRPFSTRQNVLPIAVCF